MTEGNAAPKNLVSGGMNRLALPGLLFLALAPSAARAQLFVEGQTVRPAYNNVRIPGKTGTTVSLKNLVGDDARRRVRLTYLKNVGEKHGVRIVYAPLTLRGAGTLPSPTQFKDATFSPDTPTAGTYRFNSYRASYYRRKPNEKGEWRYGVTLKVRDADIALSQGALKRNEYNLGIVPLLYVGGERKLTNRLTAHLDFDGAAAPQGRAFDIGVFLSYRISPQADLLVGARTLEGGANVSEVYNFARLNYLSAGLLWRL